MNPLLTKVFPALLIVICACPAALVLTGCGRESSPDQDAPVTRRERDRVSPELAAELARIETNERLIAQTVWAKEMLAQECGAVIEAFWDALNASTNKLALAASFPLAEIVLGEWKVPVKLDHGIELCAPGPAGPVLSAAQWKEWVEQFERAGWSLAQTEFRHNRFETSEASQPLRSEFYCSAHLTRAATAERLIVEGDLTVTWAQGPSGHGAAIDRIDASQLTLKTRRGDPPFEPLLTEMMLPPRNANAIDPLILYDLDGDGLPEIILAAKNLVYRRGADGVYRAEPLCKHPIGLITVALIADFDGDGAADFLCGKREGLVLFPGSPSGTFDQPGRIVWEGSDLEHAMFLTCGDIDQDGDLDLFLGQYKLPYHGGQLATPYYDANDGAPAYLLLNDGLGQFTDATREAGLESKRWRRSYSGSFVDLDADGHLDLVVISDFAGVDCYKNDGRGRFLDVTAQWLPDPRGFGMAHALADFNTDGLLDLLMIAMPSPTADRLEHLNLRRPDTLDPPGMRARMSFGNRLFTAQTGGGFEQTSAADSIARAGWAWGCSAFDFDNDGYPDVYIANGMESRELVRDYEREFWLHDIHVANSTDNPAVYLYLRGKVTRLRGRGESYGGYEKNRLFWNQGGASFLEIGHLFGVALQFDSRNVVAEDLDGDGRPDLIVTHFEPWPQPQQTLRVYKNRLAAGGNWIGFRFREEGSGRSPVGVRVTLQYSGQSAVRQIVTGDSHRSQHANTVFFGLGATDRVESVDIRWINGQRLTLRDPAVNRYHPIRAPATPTLSAGP